MKRQMSSKILAVFLAIVMVIMSIPLGIITAWASELDSIYHPIESINEMGALGTVVNLLEDDSLKNEKLKHIFISTSGLTSPEYVTATSGKSSVDYVIDIDNYINNMEKEWNANLDVNLRTRLLAIDIKGKFNHLKTEGSTSNNKHETLTIEVPQYLGLYSMYLKSEKSIADLWEQNEAGDYTTLKDEFVRDLLEIDSEVSPAEFFAMYGTHIVTQCRVGAYAQIVYSGNSLIEKTETNVKWNIDGTAQFDTAVVASITAGLGFKKNSENESETVDEDVTITAEIVGGPNQAILGSDASGILNGDQLGDWASGINTGNCAIFNDENLELCPIWELLKVKPEYADRMAELENYFNENINKAYADFYSEYVYSPRSADTDFTGYTFIKSAEDLNNIRQDLNGKYVLLSNIDLSGYENWAPIGDEASPFMGTFDGNGNTVTGLRITSAAGTGAGLFGHNEGTIKNLRVEGEINLEEADTSVVYAGGIAGYNAGSITNCYSGVDIDAAADIIVSEETEDTTSSSEGLSVPEGLFDGAETFTSIPTSLSGRSAAIIDLRGLDPALNTVIDCTTVTALKLIGDPNVTYTGLRINPGSVRQSADSSFDRSFYLELENVHMTGSSSESPVCLYNASYREDVWIISSGEANSISAATASGESMSAIYIVDTPLNLVGDAKLTIKGGDGRVRSTPGGDGVAGGTAICVGSNGTEIKIDIDNEVIIQGGRGGNGVAGTDGNGQNGGSGGVGGDCIYATDTNVYTVTVYNGTVRMLAGDGGNGANGGSGWDATQGKDGGHGGHGGNGGQGGTAAGKFKLLVNGASKVYTVEGICGNGGNGGRGGAGGKGWDGAVITHYVKATDGTYPNGKSRAEDRRDAVMEEMTPDNGGNGYRGGDGGNGGNGYVAGSGGAAGNRGGAGSGGSITYITLYHDSLIFNTELVSLENEYEYGSAGDPGASGYSGSSGTSDGHNKKHAAQLITSSSEYSISESIENTTWESISIDSYHLLTIGSEKEQLLIESLLAYARKDSYYMGCQRVIDGINQWEWVNKEGMFYEQNGEYIYDVTQEKAYTHFYPGEPNDGSGIEDYLSIRKDGLWNDIPGTYTCGYILEKRTAESQNTPNKHAVLSGGIAGYNTANGTIENCVAEANVSAAVNAENCGVSAYAGGIAGLNEGKITNSRFGSEDSEHSVSSSAISQSLNEFADSYAYLIGKTVGNGTLENSEAYGNVYAYAKSYNAMQTADKEELPEGAHKLTVGAYNGTDHKQYWNNSSMFEIQNVTDTDYIVNDAFNKNSVSAVYNGSPAVYTVRYNFYEAGTSTVTMTVKDKNAEYKRYLPVNVAPAVPDSLTVQNMPQTEFFIDDPFTYEGLTLKLLYNNGNFKLLSSKDYTVVSPDMGTAGNKTVTVKYAVSDTETLECTYDIVVSVIELSRLSIKQMPDKLADYMIGEAFDPTGMIVEAVYNNGKKVELDHSALNITPGTFASSGEQTVTIGYEGLSTSLTCTVAEMDVSELPHITAKNAATTPGATVQIPLVLSNNTGFAYLKLTLEYDESALTLEPVTNNASGLTMAQGIKAISWDNTSNYTADGTLCTLPFKVSDSAAVGEYEIKITVSECYDEDTDDVKLYGTTFTVKVIDFIHGDANGDGIVNGKDVIVLRRHLVDSSVEISAGADANGDGEINGKDVIILRRYLVGTAELGPNS